MVHEVQITSSVLFQALYIGTFSESMNDTRFHVTHYLYLLNCILYFSIWINADSDLTIVHQDLRYKEVLPPTAFTRSQSIKFFPQYFILSLAYKFYFVYVSVQIDGRYTWFPWGHTNTLSYIIFWRTLCEWPDINTEVEKLFFSLDNHRLVTGTYTDSTNLGDLGGIQITATTYTTYTDTFLFNKVSRSYNTIHHTQTLEHSTDCYLEAFYLCDQLHTCLSLYHRLCSWWSALFDGSSGSDNARQHCLLATAC